MGGAGLPCDAQIAYQEWVASELPQASVHACLHSLRAFLVMGRCEAKGNV